MKKILILSSLILLFTSCWNRKVKPDVHHVYLKPWELAYMPYKLGDTMSFTNKATGDVLHFKCNYYDRYKIADGDSTSECPPSWEFCSMLVTEGLEVKLKCIENSDYDFTLSMNGGGPWLQISDPSIIKSAHLQYTFPMNYSLSMCSDCTDTLSAWCSEWRCYSTRVINGYTYKDVGLDQQIGSLCSSCPIDTFGMLYYNRQFGILQFRGAPPTGGPKETWVRNHY